MPAIHLSISTCCPSSIGMPILGASKKGVPLASVRSVRRMLQFDNLTILRLGVSRPVSLCHNSLQRLLPHLHMPQAASSSSLSRLGLVTLALRRCQCTLSDFLHHMSLFLP